MSTVSVTQINPDDEITAAGANLPHNQLASVINGNLDDANISSLSGTKILGGTLPSSAFDSATLNGWLNFPGSISSVTYNGNSSYTLGTSSDNSAVVSPGMRLRTTRTVSAPTQSASLNGSNQYFSKSSPAGMTFTDDFVVSAWIKLSAYNASSPMMLASRYNGTSGWALYLESNGQVTLKGFNGGAGNDSHVSSYQSLPLNRWVHVAAQLDMSAFTATTTTSYMMFDGVDVPAFVARAGTNPTALVQAGNLEVGSWNGGLLPFNGKLAQVAVYSAKVTQANVRATIAQGLVGTETSLVSAYSFNNSINDLNAGNANNLTANGSAVATNADSPFGGQADGTISSTLDYCVVQKITASTITVQVPEGCTIPTTGGVSACSYSSFKNPYGFPGQRGKWRVFALLRANQTATMASSLNWVAFPQTFTIPIGSWRYGIKAVIQSTTSGASSTRSIFVNLNSSAPANSSASESDGGNDTPLLRYLANTGTTSQGQAEDYRDTDLAAATTYTVYGMSDGFTATESVVLNAVQGAAIIYADNAYL